MLIGYYYQLYNNYTISDSYRVATSILYETDKGELPALRAQAQVGNTYITENITINVLCKQNGTMDSQRLAQVLRTARTIKLLFLGIGMPVNYKVYTQMLARRFN